MKGISVLFVLLIRLSITAALPAARLNSLISVRGGAGPLNAKDTAKVAAYVVGAQGAFGGLAPAKANTVFGLPSNPLDNFLMKRSSMIFFSVGLLVWELVLKGTGLTKAAGICSVPVVVELLQALLNDDIKNLGFGKTQQYFLLFFWSYMIYATLTGSKYADLLVKVSAVSHVGIGLTTYFFPQESLKFFGNPAPAISTATKVHMKAFASFMLAAAVTATSLSLGKNIDAMKAVGYGWIALDFFIVDGLFLSKEFVQLRLNQGLLISWLVFHSIVVATLAF